MELEPEKEIVLQNTQIDEPPKKKRGRPRKQPIVPEAEITDELSELREKLALIATRNPEIVTKPLSVNTKAIDAMNIQELRLRVSMGRQAAANQIDGSVSQQLISLTNQLAGGLLGCAEELHESTSNDKLLQGTTREYLSMNILDSIPAELKIAGLYSSHVGASYMRSRAKCTLSEISTPISEDVDTEG